MGSLIAESAIYPYKIFNPYLLRLMYFTRWLGVYTGVAITRVVAALLEDNECADPCLPWINMGYCVSVMLLVILRSSMVLLLS